MQTSFETPVAEAQVKLPDDVDLHARPAANFVRTAMGFTANVLVRAGEKEVDAKSLLSVLALGARRGTSIRLRAEGDDASAAITALANTIAQLRE